MWDHCEVRLIFRDNKFWAWWLSIYTFTYSSAEFLTSQMGNPLRCAALLCFPETCERKMAEFLKNEMWNPHLVQLSFQEACERKWKLVTVLGYEWPFTGPMMDSGTLSCSTNRSGPQITSNLVKLLYIEILATIQSQPSWFLDHIGKFGTPVNGTYTNPLPSCLFWKKKETLHSTPHQTICLVKPDFFQPLNHLPLQGKRKLTPLDPFWDLQLWKTGGRICIGWNPMQWACWQCNSDMKFNLYSQQLSTSD